MAALDRAVAFAEKEDGAVRVGDDLGLDVARVLEVALDVDRVVGEVGRALALGRLERRRRLVRVSNHLEALAAAAGRRLDGERPAELVADAHELLDRLEGLCRARHDRNAGSTHALARRDLRSHRLDRVGRRADPDEPCVLDQPRERCVLREEAVAGMDRVCPRPQRDVDEPLRREVRLGRSARAQDVCLVGISDVRRAAIGLGVDGDGSDVELAERSKDANRDLSAVRDEDLRERHALILSRR